MTCSSHYQTDWNLPVFGVTLVGTVGLAAVALLRIGFPSV